MHCEVFKFKMNIHILKNVMFSFHFCMKMDCDINRLSLLPVQICRRVIIGKPVKIQIYIPYVRTRSSPMDEQ